MVLSTIGPSFAAEAYLPRLAPGLNPDLPEWHWGSIPASFKVEMNSWLSGYIGQYKQEVLSSSKLDPMTVEDYRVEPRPIVEGLLDDVAKNPVGFFEDAFGINASP
jgi:hypothetical protein